MGSLWTMIHFNCYSFLLFLFKVSADEYFTSSTHLRSLLEKELYLQGVVEDYIIEKESKLNSLKDIYGKISKVDETVKLKNITDLVGNPLFSYSSFSRWQTDWNQALELVNENKWFHTLLLEEKKQFPTPDDVYGAKSAILRLQETFALPTKRIASGIEQLSSGLSIVDIYQIGYTAFKQNKAYQTASWMKEVLRLLDQKKIDVELNITRARFQALDVLSWAEYQIDNLLAAYKSTKELLEIDPNHERLTNNLVLIENAIVHENISLNDETLEQSLMNDEEPEKFFARNMMPYDIFYYSQEEDEGYRYEIERARANALCRGETDPIPVEYEKYLICWYKRNNPLLVLKPAKVERVYPHPEILVFRDVITDTEMDYIKSLAQPLLKRATVNNPQTGKLEFANYRISKSAWLNAWHDKDLLKKMNNRIDALTGLDMRYSEDLQIANYGIGGFYEPHFDFARIVPIRPPPSKKRDDYTYQRVTPFHKKNSVLGERIATVLFYMSEVISGGGTVFTNIGQTITPSKGDAVFWYNLMHDGSGDYLTRHAACPVLVGEKWVCNRWLHEYGQEFRRPCKLNHDDDWF